jgi:23S rRNA (guanosine2251-2'-O)-methyltransferase
LRTNRPDGKRELEYIFGVHAVAEAIAAGEPLERIIVGRRRTVDRELSVVLKEAAARGTRVEVEEEATFRRFGDARHQHVVAVAPPFHYTEWGALLAAVRARPDAIVVALDHIEDPHNVGAIIRNAEAAGAVGAVLPDRRSAAVTAAVRRASAGATSHLAIARVPNLVRAFADLKHEGCWVIGTAATPGAHEYTSIDLTGRCVIVIGAEGKGISRLALVRCDLLARIPMQGKIASLNASSASAIMLFEAVRQRSQHKLVTSRTSGQSPVNP